MGIKAVRVCLILVISLVVFFPGITSSLAFSAVEIPQRGIQIPTADNNQTGVIGINQQDSVQIGGSNEELVELTNNMASSKQTEVDLDNQYSWQIADPEGPVRTIPSGSTEVYNADLSGVNTQDNQGSYVIRATEGSFLFEAERTVNFEQPQADILTISGEPNNFITTTQNTSRFYLQVDGSRINIDNYQIDDTGSCAGASFGGCSSADIWSDNPSALEISSVPAQGPRPGGAIFAEVGGSTGTGTVYLQDPFTGQIDTVSFDVRSPTPIIKLDILSVGDTIEGSDVVADVELTNTGTGSQNVDVEAQIQGIGSVTQQVSLNPGAQEVRQFQIPTQQGDGRSNPYDITVESTDLNGNTVDQEQSQVSVIPQSNNPTGININRIFAQGVQNNAGTTYEGDTVIFEILVSNPETQPRTEDVTLNIGSLGFSQTKTVTMPAEQTETVQFQIPTEVGDGTNQRSLSYTVLTNTNKLSNSFDLLSVRPIVQKYQVRRSGNDVQLNSVSIQSRDVRDTARTIDFVEAKIFVDGSEDANSPVVLVRNGQLTGNEKSGSVSLSPQQFDAGPLVLATDQNVASGGGADIEVALTVVDSGGAEVTLRESN